MPIVVSDIKTVLSGGAANTDPNAALGGAASTDNGGVITSASLNNIFDDVAGAESSAGDVEYRCIYVKNTHGSLTLQGAKVYLASNTPSTDTNVEIGLGTSAISGTEQTVADESTSPAGVAFGTAAGVENALTIGDLAPGATKAVWIRRTVTAAASAYNSDGFTLGVTGDTAA